MTPSTSQANGHSNRYYSTTKKEDDWPFQSNTSLEISYKDNFDADISAALEDPNDSGCILNANLESSKDKVTIVDRNDYLWSTDSVQGDSYSEDVAASIKSNHGSIYDGQKNESTATLERVSPPGQTLKSSKRARLFDFDDSSLPQDSVFGDQRNISRHGKRDSGRESGSFGEEVEVSEGKSQRNGFLKFDRGLFLFLGIYLSAWLADNVSITQIAIDGELDSFLGNRNTDSISEDGKILADLLELV